MLLNPFMSQALIIAIVSGYGVMGLCFFFFLFLFDCCSCMTTDGFLLV